MSTSTPLGFSSTNIDTDVCSDIFTFGGVSYFSELNTPALLEYQRIFEHPQAPINTNTKGTAFPIGYAEGQEQESGAHYGYINKLHSSNPRIQLGVVDLSNVSQTITVGLQAFLEGETPELNDKTITSILNIDPTHTEYLFASLESDLENANYETLQNIQKEVKHYMCLFKKSYSMALTEATSNSTNATAYLQTAKTTGRALIVLLLLTYEVTKSASSVSTEVLQEISGDGEFSNASIQNQVNSLIKIQNDLSGSKSLYKTQHEMKIYQEQLSRKENIANTSMAILLLLATLGVITYLGNPVVTSIITVAIIGLAIVILMGSPTIAVVVGGFIAVVVVFTSYTNMGTGTSV